MDNGYVTSFFYLQYAVLMLVEYVCRDGHRIHVRTDQVDWQDSKMVWQ